MYFLWIFNIYYQVSTKIAKDNVKIEKRMVCISNLKLLIKNWVSRKNKFGMSHNIVPTFYTTITNIKTERPEA